MPLTQEDVRHILDLLEGSAFDRLELEIGDLKLTASKSRVSGQETAPKSTAAVSATPAASPAAAPQPAVSQPAPPEPIASPPVAAPQDEVGLVEIKAPIVGTFYIAPEPGAPPFVEEGDRVNDDSTVGTIEVMKVFNNIRAEVTGTVVRRLPANGDFVEFGQTLFLVRPEG